MENNPELKTSEYLKGINERTEEQKLQNRPQTRQKKEELSR